VERDLLALIVHSSQHLQHGTSQVRSEIEHLGVVWVVVRQRGRT
jgi:hypothetical protein